MTSNLSNTAKFVPGTYELIVQAPGYGIQRFTRSFAANQTETIVISMPTNRASLTKGATVATTANTADKNNLIDDTEDTGAQVATIAPIAGSSITVDLAGSTPVTVTNVTVSAAAGPNNAGRFTGIRKFEIRTCNGLCLNPVTDFTNVAFTSPDNAFPGDVRDHCNQTLMRETSRDHAHVGYARAASCPNHAMHGTAKICRRSGRRSV